MGDFQNGVRVTVKGHLNTNTGLNTILEISGRVFWGVVHPGTPLQSEYMEYIVEMQQLAVSCLPYLDFIFNSAKIIRLSCDV